MSGSVACGGGGRGSHGCRHESAPARGGARRTSDAVALQGAAWLASRGPSPVRVIIRSALGHIIKLTHCGPSPVRVIVRSALGHHSWASAPHDRMLVVDRARWLLGRVDLAPCSEDWWMTMARPPYLPFPHRSHVAVKRGGGGGVSNSLAKVCERLRAKRTESLCVVIQVLTHCGPSTVRVIVRAIAGRRAMSDDART